jgi:MSHA biogenesis protein MshE
MAEIALQPLRFGDFLVEKNLINEGQLLDALADHWISGRRLGETMVQRGYLSAEALTRYLAEFDGLAVVYV